MRGNRKAEGRRQARADIRPRQPAIGAAPDPMGILLTDQVTRPGCAPQVVHAQPGFAFVGRGGIGAAVAPVPCRAAILGGKDPGGRDADPEPRRVARVIHDRMQRQPRRPRFPPGTRRMVAQALHPVPRRSAVPAFEQRRGLGPGQQSPTFHAAHQPQRPHCGDSLQPVGGQRPACTAIVRPPDARPVPVAALRRPEPAAPVTDHMIDRPAARERAGYLPCIALVRRDKDALRGPQQNAPPPCRCHALPSQQTGRLADFPRCAGVGVAVRPRRGCPRHAPLPPDRHSGRRSGGVAARRSRPQAPPQVHPARVHRGW